MHLTRFSCCAPTALGRRAPLVRSIPRVLCLAALVSLCAGTALAQRESDPYFEFLLARRLEASGDTRGALAALERAAAADPDSAELRAEIAAFHLRHDQPEQAETAAKAALALNAENAEANRVLGLTYAGYVEGAGRRPRTTQVETYLREAIQYLERAIAASPTDVRLNYTLGQLYIRSGAADKAVESLVRVVNQSPFSADARLALAQAYAATSDLKNAMATLEEIVRDEPRVAAMLGSYQEQAGLLEQAADTYTQALAVQPTSRQLKVRRIAVLLNAKAYSRAAAFAADGRRQHPDDPAFARLHARALFDGGDRSGAISLLESTVRAFPKDSGTQLALVDMYSDAGRENEAEKVLRQILGADPANPDALNYLGYMLAQRGQQLDEAINLVRRALDADPENPAYLDSLGWAYFKRGDLAEAEKYLAPAAERMPHNSEVQDHLGDLLARRGRWNDAIAAWTRALDGDGQDVDRAAIQRKITDARARLGR